MKCVKDFGVLIKDAVRKVHSYLADRSSTIILITYIAFMMICVVTGVYATIYPRQKRVFNVLSIVMVTGVLVGHRRILNRVLHLLVTCITEPLKYFMVMLPIELFLISLFLPVDAMKNYVALSTFIAFIISIICAYRCDQHYRESIDIVVKGLKNSRIAFAATAVVISILSVIFLVLLAVDYQQRATVYPMLHAVITFVWMVFILVAITEMGVEVLNPLLKVAFLALYLVVSYAIALVANTFIHATLDLSGIQTLGLALLFLLITVCMLLRDTDA